MNEDLILKMAQAQTVIDAIELLLYLRNESSSAHRQAIDDMIQRLTNMAHTLAS